MRAQVERRPGGEAGVVAVRCLVGDAIWAAAAEGGWPIALAQVAEGGACCHSPQSVLLYMKNPYGDRFVLHDANQNGSAALAHRRPSGS